jgi:hypothetical protein
MPGALGLTFLHRRATFPPAAGKTARWRSPWPATIVPSLGLTRVMSPALPPEPRHCVALHVAFCHASALAIGLGVLLSSLAPARSIAEDALSATDMLATDPNVTCPPLYVTDPGGDLPLMGPAYPAPMLGWQGGCNDCGTPHGCGTCWPRWFASASGLVMTRTLPSGVPVSTGPGGSALVSADASANWPGGVDLRIGRWFGPQQRHGVELIYWGLYNIGSAADADGGGLNAIPSLAPSLMVGATPADTFFTNASSQQIARNDLVNDVEVNWLYTAGPHPDRLDENHRWSWVWVAGFRYFQLLDSLTLTSPFNTSDPLMFNVTTNNNLLGAQVGTRVDWRFAQRFRLAAIPKFMIGGSSVSNLSSLETADGTLATYGNSMTVSGRSTGSTFAYLGSVDGLVAWDVTDQWSLWLGYRVVGVGNILQSDAVWPTSITGPDSLSAINTSGSTIVHGGFAGFESRF